MACRRSNVGGVSLTAATEEEDIDADLHDELALALEQQQQNESSDLYKLGHQIASEHAHYTHSSAVAVLEQRHADAERRLNESITHSENVSQHITLESMQRLMNALQHKLPQREMACEAISADVIQCYTQHRSSPLACKAIVDAYSSCTQQAQIALLKQKQ